MEAESEFSKLNLAEDEIIKSVYEGSNSSNYTSSTSVIRSDGGNANDNSVANPYTNIPRPQVILIKSTFVDFLSFHIIFMNFYLIFYILIIVLCSWWKLCF